MGRPPRPGEFMQPVGHFSDVSAARAAMQITWMTRDELAQAIPPAYTRHVGQAALGWLTSRTALHQPERALAYPGKNAGRDRAGCP
jgi:hypothetical protein